MVCTRVMYVCSPNMLPPSFSNVTITCPSTTYSWLPTTVSTNHQFQISISLSIFGESWLFHLSYNRDNNQDSIELSDLLGPLPVRWSSWSGFQDWFHPMINIHCIRSSFLSMWSLYHIYSGLIYLYQVYNMIHDQLLFVFYVFIFSSSHISNNDNSRPLFVLSAIDCYIIVWSWLSRLVTLLYLRLDLLKEIFRQ